MKIKKLITRIGGFYLDGYNYSLSTVRITQNFALEGLILCLIGMNEKEWKCNESVKNKDE